MKRGDTPAEVVAFQSRRDDMIIENGGGEDGKPRRGDILLVKKLFHPFGVLGALTLAYSIILSPLRGCF